MSINLKKNYVFYKYENLHVVVTKHEINTNQ